MSTINASKAAASSRVMAPILALLALSACTLAPSVRDAPPELIQAVWDLNVGPTAQAIEQARK